MSQEITLSVELVFTGSVTVEAISKEDALRLIKERFSGALHSCGDKTDERFIDWEFPTFGETRISF